MEGFISSHEAKTRFGDLLKRVEKGEELIITRHDMPVARIVPAQQSSKPELEVLFRRITAERSANPLNQKGNPKISIRQLIDEGRK